MKSEMLPRERVEKALAFEEPDRVPTAIWGGPYGIVDELYLKLIKTFNIKEPVIPFRAGHNISFMDNRVLEKFGTDLRYVYPTLSPTSPSQTTNEPNTFLDAYGQVWKRAYPYYYAGSGILSEIHKIDQIDEIVKWPDPKEPCWFNNLAERAQELRGSTDYWITARMINSHGPFQMACDLRGTERLLMDLMINEDFAKALLSHIGDSLCSFLDQYLLACGQFIDMIELPGDDYAGNENLIISPILFNKYIQPIIKRMVGIIKTFRPEIKVMLHSDGAIKKLIPDLINCGIDVIHPLEPLPATDQAAVKSEFGSKIAFLGGIDITHAMTGSTDDVKREVFRCVQQLAPGGGFILAPSNHLQPDVPPENVIALFANTQIIGKYPINIQVS